VVGPLQHNARRAGGASVVERGDRNHALAGYVGIFLAEDVGDAILFEHERIGEIAAAVIGKPAPTAVVELVETGERRLAGRAPPNADAPVVVADDEAAQSPLDQSGERRHGKSDGGRRRRRHDVAGRNGLVKAVRAKSNDQRDERVGDSRTARAQQVASPNRGQRRGISARRAADRFRQFDPRRATVEQRGVARRIASDAVVERNDRAGFGIGRAGQVEDEVGVADARRAPRSGWRAVERRRRAWASDQVFERFDERGRGRRGAASLARLDQHAAAIGGEPLGECAVPTEEAALRQQQADDRHCRRSRKHPLAGEEFQPAANSARTEGR